MGMINDHVMLGGAFDAHELRQQRLRDISALDPDGGRVEPTEEDYQRFQDHVVRHYGQDMWDAYNGGRYNTPEPNTYRPESLSIADLKRMGVPVVEDKGPREEEA